MSRRRMSYKALSTNLYNLMGTGKKYTLDDLYNYSGAYQFMTVPTFRDRLRKQFKEEYYHARDKDNVIRYRIYSEHQQKIPSYTENYEKIKNAIYATKSRITGKCGWLK